MYKYKCLTQRPYELPFFIILSRFFRFVIHRQRVSSDPVLRERVGVNSGKQGEGGFSRIPTLLC